MKKTLTTLFAAACLMLAAASFAQTAGPAGGAPAVGAAQRHHGGGLKKMEAAFAKLDLSPDQKKQIKELMGKAQAERKALMQKVKAGTLTRDQAREQFMAEGKGTHEAILKVLTPAQQKQLKAILKSEHKGKAKPGTTPPPAN